MLRNMQFHNNPCVIKDYTKKRPSNSDLETIINCTNLTVVPISYVLLQKAQPNSAAVKRSVKCSINYSGKKKNSVNYSEIWMLKT